MTAICTPWERWFAWRPVLLDDGSPVWMQVLERRQIGPGAVNLTFLCPPYRWQYRARPPLAKTGERHEP